MAFQDKNEFKADDREEPTTARPLFQDSLDDDIDELDTEQSEAEFADDEMEEFTAADWKQEFPDATDEEYEEKLPDHTSARWMAPVISCVFGTLLGAAIAGVLVNDQPKPLQARAFFIFFLVLAPLFSSLGLWLFVLRPESVARKMKDEQEDLVDAEPVQHENPVDSKPIHPE
jgi:hypothetical protein